MASDNPSFVDTENTSAERGVQGGGDIVDTAPQIATTPSADGTDDGGGSRTAPPLTSDPVVPVPPSTPDPPSTAPPDYPHSEKTPSANRDAHEDPESEPSEEKMAVQYGGKVDGEISERGGNSAGGGALSQKTPVYRPGEEKRMLRNAIGVGVVFMVHFTATLGVTHLQSSVNKEKGLGTSALAAQYTGLVISSLLLSVFIISKLGCKWTMVVAILCNVPYMLAQMLPRVYTLVPTAFLMGLAVAPLWSAKCTYLCVVAEARAAVTSRALSVVRDQVIGLFFMVFLLSMVWGNLVSSLVLSRGESSHNSSLTISCGVDYCPNSDAVAENPNLERPPQEKIILIIGIYVGFMLLGALIAGTYVDSLKRYSEGSRASSATGLTTRGLLTATLGLHTRKEMLFLIPLSVWLGVDYAFVEAEYTASFVACAWGIQNIGYVIIVYGLANSALALCTGWLVARIGRRPVLCGAAVMHLALMAGMLAWQPAQANRALFFVVAACWGAMDGHWCVQLNSLYAILFPNMEEAAYSNFRLWQSIGFVIAFSYSHHLCTIYKLYVVMALLVVGVAGYLGIEWTRPRKVRLFDG